MKISIFNNYGALNSQLVFAAIAAGFKKIGHNVVFNSYDADVAVIWSMLWQGRMKNNQQVYETFRTSGREVVVAEVGMISREHTWKLGLNGTSKSHYPHTEIDPNRAKFLDLKCSPWRNNGTNIIIACQRTDSQQWKSLPNLDTWLTEIITKLRCYTDRPIIVRPHPRGSQPKIKCAINMPRHLPMTYDSYDYDQVLSTTWAVINHNSSPGPQAILSGVPAFVDASSLASAVGNLDYAQIENPLRPDRTQWINWLAHTEWTLEEIKSGMPLNRLLQTVQ